MLTSILLVFTGGGLGSLARYGISEALKKADTNFPTATLLANALSCAILGLALGIFADKLLAQPALRLFIIIGFCGGFSTFSTFSSETLELFRNGNAAYAIANILLSLALCIFILFLLIKKTPAA